LSGNTRIIRGKNDGCSESYRRSWKVYKGKYSFSFKLLGFMVYVAQEGNERLLSGSLISQKTYYRWMDLISQAGWGELVADARLRNTIQDYLWSRFAGLPIARARRQVIKAVDLIISESEAPSLQAIGRQESGAVKGERSETEGREAKPSALDGDATGGRLEKAMAPNVLGNTPAL